MVPSLPDFAAAPGEVAELPDSASAPPRPPRRGAIRLIEPLVRGTPAEPPPREWTARTPGPLRRQPAGEAGRPQPRAKVVGPPRATEPAAALAEPAQAPRSQRRRPQRRSLRHPQRRNLRHLPRRPWRTCSRVRLLRRVALCLTCRVALSRSNLHPISLRGRRRRLRMGSPRQPAPQPLPVALPRRRPSGAQPGRF